MWRMANAGVLGSCASTMPIFSVSFFEKDLHQNVFVQIVWMEGICVRRAKSGRPHPPTSPRLLLYGFPKNIEKNKQTKKKKKKKTLLVFVPDLDETTRTLLLQCSEKVDTMNFTQNDVHEEYVKQQLKREWVQFKQSVLKETMQDRGIRPGHGKWPWKKKTDTTTPKKPMPKTWTEWQFFPVSYVCCLPVLAFLQLQGMVLLGFFYIVLFLFCFFFFFFFFYLI